MNCTCTRTSIALTINSAATVMKYGSGKWQLLEQNFTGGSGNNKKQNSCLPAVYSVYDRQYRQELNLITLEEWASTHCPLS